MKKGRASKLTKSTISHSRLLKVVSCLISLLCQEDSQSHSQDTSSRNSCQDSIMSIKMELPTEILSLKISCSICNITSRLQISDLLLQLKEETEAVPSTPNSELSTIWHQKSTWNKPTAENLSICLLLQLSYLSWLLNIHHSQQLNQLIHSTDV